MLLREIVKLKERLAVRVEFASPLDVPPELPGWRGRSPFPLRAAVQRLARRGLVADPFGRARNVSALSPQMRNTCVLFHITRRGDHRWMLPVVGPTTAHRGPLAF